MAAKKKSGKEKKLAERSFDLRTSGLWAQHASTAPLCYTVSTGRTQVSRLAVQSSLQGKNDAITAVMSHIPAITQQLACMTKWLHDKSLDTCVRRGIRTLALRRGPRPERGALDHSAILTETITGEDEPYQVDLEENFRIQVQYLLALLHSCTSQTAVIV